jgi:Bacteriophage clamp loader A subunit
VINVFTYINALNAGQHMEVDEKIYSKFLVTRFFSYFVDTVLIADMANSLHSPTVSAQNHFDFYLNLVSPKKRFTKWFKGEKDETVEMVSEYFQVSYDKAREALKCLKKEQLVTIKEWWNEKSS